MQQAARIPRRAARRPGCGGQAVLPDGDLLAGERVELPYTPVRPDEPADQVLAVLRGAETDILRGLPAFDPLADRDLTRRRGRSMCPRGPSPPGPVPRRELLASSRSRTRWLRRPGPCT